MLDKSVNINNTAKFTRKKNLKITNIGSGY